MGDLSASVPAEDDEPALAKTVRKHPLHLLRLLERHRIQVLVQPGHEAFAVTLHDARALDAVLVILETLLRRQPGHTDVVAGPAVALGIAQIDDVDGMMVTRPPGLLRR